jgi:hypothetical protein
MGQQDFNALQVGDTLRSTVYPDRIFTIVRKAKDGFRVVPVGEPSKRPVRAATPSAWAKVVFS